MKLIIADLHILENCSEIQLILIKFVSKIF